MKYYFKCPKCQNDEEFMLPKQEATGLGCLLLFFGGIMSALLYADSTHNRVQCSGCGYIFRQPQLPRTTISVFALSLIGIIFLFTILTIILIIVPDIERSAPQSPTLKIIEEYVSSNPKAIVYGIFPMIAVILLLSFMASWFSSSRAKEELRKQYETKPKEYSEVKLRHQQGHGA